MKKKFLIFSSFVLIFVLSFSFIVFADPPEGYIQYQNVSFANKTNRAYTITYDAVMPGSPDGYYSRTLGSYFNYPNLSTPFTRVQNIFISSSTGTSNSSDRFGLELGSSLSDPFIQYSSIYLYYFEFKISLAHSSNGQIDSADFINKYVRSMNILFYDSEEESNPINQTITNDGISLSFYKLDSNYIYFRGYFDPTETDKFDRVALIMPRFAYNSGDTITCVFYDFDLYYTVDTGEIYVNGDFVKSTSSLAQTLHDFETSILFSLEDYFVAFRERFSANSVLFLEMDNEFTAFKGLFDGLLASNAYINAFLNLSITLGCLGLLIGVSAYIGKGGKRK